MPAIVVAAAAPGGASNLFSALLSPSPLPLPTKKPKPKPPPPPTTKNHGNDNPNPRKPSTALRTTHSRTHYHKPVPPGGAVLGEGERAVVVGASRVSYRLPGGPFEFRFSYSETPRAAPLAIREPAFLPFAPPVHATAVDREGPAAVQEGEGAAPREDIRLFEPLGGASAEPEAEKGAVVLETRGRRPLELGNYAAGDGRSREEVLGPPLTRAEVRALLRFPNLDHDESDLDDDLDSLSSSSSAAAVDGEGGGDRRRCRRGRRGVLLGGASGSGGSGEGGALAVEGEGEGEGRRKTTGGVVG